MSNSDGFCDYDNWLERPYKDEPKVAMYCYNCGSEIYVGETAIYYEEEYYCKTSCLLDQIDYAWVEVGD